MAHMVKNLPAVQETWIPSLGREDPLEKGMASHSSILAWRIPGTGEPGGLPSVGLHRVGHDLAAAAVIQGRQTQVSGSEYREEGTDLEKVLEVKSGAFKV